MCIKNAKATSNASPYRWTVDVESDWGGRTLSLKGVERGLPRILSLFKQHRIKGLFFISTELFNYKPNLARDIASNGHGIGSHGHFHVSWKRPERVIQDSSISFALLQRYQAIHYRAPKFSHVTDCMYSSQRGHTGLLRLTHGLVMKVEPIIYLHPFDIVETSERPPNLFCKLWYSNPHGAWKKLEELCSLFGS